MRVTLVLAAALVVAAGQPVAAQRMPDAATVDRGDGFSKLGLDLGFLSIDRADIDSVVRIEPHGQFVARSGLGVYFALPLAASFGDDDLGVGDEAALGNLDLGGLYVVSGPDLSLVFRLGLVVPTASESPAEYTVNTLATVARLTDLALTNPDAWFARIGFSPLIHARNLFLRVDLGADIPFAEDDFRADPILRLNLAGGVDLGVAALGLELASIADVDDDEDDPDGDEDLFHTLALSARFMHESLQPFVSIGLPLDDSVRGPVELFLAAGIQGVLR